MRARVLGITIAVALLGSIVAASPAAAAPTPARLAGDSAYSIAASASKKGWPSGASTLVVTSGTDYLTSTVAAVAAANLGGPLLLGEKSKANSTTGTEATRLAPAKIVVVGAPAASGSKTLAQLRAIQSNTVTVGSATSTAYDDGEALTRLAFPAGVDHVYLAPGSSTPSTLLAGALAGADRAPLLLVRTADRSARATLTALLTELGVEDVTIIGSTAGVSAGVQSSLTTAGYAVTRVTEPDRYALSYELAARYAAHDGVIVASGAGYAKAVGAVALAASTRTPLVLSLDYCAPAGLVSLASGLDSVTLAGSAKSIRGLVGSLEPCRDITKASSTWVLANKKNKLSPSTYVPNGLRLPNIQRSGSHQLKDSAADALEDMVADARSDGSGRIGISSGYRSYSTQKALYARYVRERGQKWADSQSARAGFSEHQTGLAADLMACGSSSCGSIYAIASTPQGKWLAKNSWEYGFILRYGNGYTATTGYAYEPWHFRYVGPELAADYHAGGFKTLEGYLGKPAAPRY